MSIDIKTTSVEAKRVTFDHLAAKLGEGKVPSRYQEVMFGVQAEEVFHYRPTWDPEHELYDADRTAINMEDFEALVDPRQYYYGTYVIQRSKQQESCEHNYSLVEKRGLLDSIPEQLKEQIQRIIIPFRHFEWGSNTNNYFIASYGFGTPIAAAATFQAMDRLGNAQYMTRIGLILSNLEPEILDQARQEWLDDPMWQPLRKTVEDSFVLKDWFELHLLQNFLLDGLLHPLLFKHFDDEIITHGGASFAMLTEFFSDWYKESCRWVDNTLKIAAAESEENKSLLNQWAANWMPEAEAAAKPLAEYIFADRSEDVMGQIRSDLQARAKKIGITLA